MVVGSSIAFLVANDLTATKSKGDVVHMAMASEHRMGLKNGGMDVSPASIQSLRLTTVSKQLLLFPCPARCSTSISSLPLRLCLSLCPPRSPWSSPTHSLLMSSPTLRLGITICV